MELSEEKKTTYRYIFSDGYEICEEHLGERKEELEEEHGKLVIKCEG